MPLVNCTDQNLINMRRFFLDVVLCTFFIFGLMGTFASVTAFRVFDLFDPIGEMFADFELTDLVMSQLRSAPPADEQIVVVNIGELDRSGIAEQIFILEQYEPKVIGVDVTFSSHKTYAEDSLLVAALTTYDNIVIGSELRMFNEETEEFDTLVVPEERLAAVSRFGYVNTVTEAENQDDLKACRDMTPIQPVKGVDHYAFPVMLAMAMDSAKTQKFLDRGNMFEPVNYKGNVMDFGQTNFGTRYYALDVYDLFSENFVPEMIKDKVVILCYMGKFLGDLQTREDKYFTPLNKRYVGKSEPDMFGGVIHANVVSMILQEDYIDELNANLAIALAIIMCLFNVTLFKWVYGALPKWYDGITKVFQLCQLLVFSFLMVMVFHYWNFKLDLTLTLIVIALSGDSIEVYHGVVKNLFIKRERQQLFKVNWKFYLER
ncbi:MAG: CHASE2 domain-containing protein [Cyclobacteriaceae bacterium]